jgi:hypothetical protein
MKYILLALFGAASLTACSSENSTATSNKDVLMHNDFESMVGWVPDPTALTQDEAHSGHYSLKVDEQQEYSLNYKNLLGYLSPTRIRGVRVEAWVYASTQNPSAQIRVALNEAAGGTTIMNDGIGFASQVKDSNKWVKVSKEVLFPSTANYTSQLVIYLWRGDGSSKAYIDDIQLTALR